MPAQWPQEQSFDVPALAVRGVRLRAGVVVNAERWSSTRVSGSVGGSVYNGTGGVSGSISSKTTQHQRVYIHYPSSGQESALNLDDWQFDVRSGHTVIVVLPPENRRGSDHPVLVHNVNTGQTGPHDMLTAGRVARRFASAPKAGLWFWRAVALALAVAPAAYIEVASPEFARRMKDNQVYMLQLVSIVVLLLIATLPLWRAAKRAYLRGLGRRLARSLRDPIAALGQSVPKGMTMPTAGAA